MEPIGLCGGGAVALALFLVAVIGSAVLAGGVALALAKLGVTVDAWYKRRGRPAAAAPDRSSEDAQQAEGPTSAR